MVEKIDFSALYELASSNKDKKLRNSYYVDYILTLSIPKIQKKFNFILKEGTALIKCFLYPYRFSYDMDFSLFGGGRKSYKKYADRLKEYLTSIGFKITESRWS